MNIDYILKTFDYNFETGDLFRVLTGGIRALSGTEANGYIRSKVDGKLEYNHRIAWAMYYQEQPPEFIDHIDRDKKNNSIVNLRRCTLSQNQANRNLSSNNTSGFTGVSFLKNRNKFKSTIYKDSKPIYLGLFSTAADASEAYIKAKGIYHGLV